MLKESDMRNVVTGDHALIDINKLLGLNPKQVTVRTKSRDSQSADSVPTPIPSAALKNKMGKVWIILSLQRFIKIS